MIAHIDLNVRGVDRGKTLRRNYDNVEDGPGGFAPYEANHSAFSCFIDPSQVVRRCNAKKDINILLSKLLQFWKGCEGNN